jgi:hypothetical protein
MADANDAAVKKGLANIKKLTDKAASGGRLGMELLGNELRNEMVKELSHPGTGRVYQRGSRVHRASSPGSPPAPDFGDYRKSWLYRVKGQGKNSVLEFTTTLLERFGWLEYGTSRMAPRPHLRTVLNRIIYTGRASKIIRDAIAEQQRGA